MYTMGREREKAFLAGNRYYRRELDLHFALIDAFHDWADGKASVDRALARVFDVIDAKSTKMVLETAGYWFRRAVAKERAFEEYVFRLASHESTMARIYASGEMSEPSQERELALIGALLNDRSRRVRELALDNAEMGRWLTVVPLLRQSEAMQGHTPERLDRAVSLITHGYYELEGEVVHYVGRGPGGAGGLGGTEISRAEEAKSVLSRVGAEELEYRRLHGRWPKRPSEGHDSIESLKRWSPL